MTWSCRAGLAERSAAGFTACGDATFAWVQGGAALFAVVDALGHGPEAADSARRAAEVLAGARERPLAEVFAACDRALAGRRPVVLSAIQLREDRVFFVGIGNVELYGPKGARRPPLVPGVVGRGLRAVREWPLEVEVGHRWALASDGLERRAAANALEAARALVPEEAVERVLASATADDDAAVVIVDWSRR